MNVSTALDIALKAAGIPIDGVAVYRRARTEKDEPDAVLPWDKSKWRIDFKDEATPAQMAAARQVLAAFALDE